MEGNEKIEKASTRVANPKDAVAVVDLFDEAFSTKFVSAVKDPALRKELWLNVINFEQVTIAELDGEILGMMLVSFDSSPGFKKIGLRELFKLLGFRKSMRAAFVFSLFNELDWKPNKQRSYIEAISVAAAARGLGLGSLLLKSHESFAKGNGLAAIDLSVVFGNEPAKRLYHRLGFVEVETKASSLLQRFTGVAGANVMRYEL